VPPPDGDDPHVFFHGRTPAIEWDAPIRVAGYGWTGWKHVVLDDQVAGSVDLGPI
jgi:hypothetical protein